MKQYKILYNPKAGGGTGAERTRQLEQLLSDADLSFYDLTAEADLPALLASFPADAGIVLCGGDGTLNCFVNAIDRLPEQELLYYATGSGNDFCADVGHKTGDPPFPIKQYLKELPTVAVGGVRRRFINGIGYGIDGYCCQEGDRLRATSSKPINYTSIAIKGLLFHYQPANAEVIVDGVSHTYRKVWLAPTMNGRYYGGGMEVAPAQDRLNAAREQSVVVMYGSGKLKTLIVFPSIFKGEHVKHKEMVEVLTGHEITVKFDRPCALQIDGETVLGVTEYSVSSKVPAAV